MLQCQKNIPRHELPKWTLLSEILFLSTTKSAPSVYKASAPIQFIINLICSKSTTSISKSQWELPFYAILRSILFSQRQKHFEDHWTLKIHFPLNFFLLCHIYLQIRFSYLLVPGAIFFCPPFRTLRCYLCHYKLSSSMSNWDSYLISELRSKGGGLAADLKWSHWVKLEDCSDLCGLTCSLTYSSSKVS